MAWSNGADTYRKSIVPRILDGLYWSSGDEKSIPRCMKRHIVGFGGCIRQSRLDM